ncbi:unnamed protein product [Plutella xylostella]|uniref:(diamondback moth) hypothetical protein n=1 Tax=Plutella xylostella TaxID=51655 RepID=A0A8S4G4L5_PLUXY|nr:unnamed protein product [Plutella xylostella]
MENNPREFRIRDVHSVFIKGTIVQFERAGTESAIKKARRRYITSARTQGHYVLSVCVRRRRILTCARAARPTYSSAELAGTATASVCLTCVFSVWIGHTEGKQVVEAKPARPRPPPRADAPTDYTSQVHVDAPEDL